MTTTTRKKADANNKYRVWAWLPTDSLALPVCLGRVRAATFRMACEKFVDYQLNNYRLYPSRRLAMQDRAKVVPQPRRRRFYIWANDPSPTLIGRVSASTFELACARRFAGHPFYNMVNNTFFGAQLYPSYKAASARSTT